MSTVKDVEQKAIDFVLEYERKAGRSAKNVSRTGCGYDVLSSDRKIEVKGDSAPKPGFENFNRYNFQALQKEDNFWLYVVYNIKAGNPKLVVLDKNEVLRRAKFTYSWEIPIWKKDMTKG